MIKVHYLNESRAHRVLWLLEELGVPYEIVRYERNRKTRQAPPELRAIHPLGKSPVIEDRGRIVAESAVILEYLADTYGEGQFIPPRGSEAYWDCLYWLHYSEGSAMPLLFVKYLFMLLPSRAPFLVRPVVSAVSKRTQAQFTDPQFRNHIDYWEETLSGRAWFAGDAFTIADIQMAYPVEVGVSRFNMGKGHSSVHRWMRSVRARPAYHKALDAVGEKAP